MEISILNTGLGDQNLTLNTKVSKERARVEALIEDKLKEGAAVFIKINGDDFRVQGYDPKTDELIVRRNTIVARQRTFRHPGNEAKLTIVPPRAGG